jgi:phenylacetate-coenzyme A ligase PaaK-like adenylate-forming protein
MLPIISRTVFFPLQEWLKGKPTLVRLREIEQSQWWSPTALRERQWRALHGLLEFTYREVPYYTRLLDEHGLQPTRIQSFENLPGFPTSRVTWSVAILMISSPVGGSEGCSA